FDRSSTTTTSNPAASSSTQVCDPIYPAPPVTRILAIPILPRVSRSARTKKKAGLPRPFLPSIRPATSGRLLLRLDRLGAIDQLDDRHRRVVAVAETELQDAGVTPVALGEARAQFVEQLDDHLAITQAVEGQTAVGQAGLLAQGDHRLHHAAKLLRLR